MQTEVSSTYAGSSLEETLQSTSTKTSLTSTWVFCKSLYDVDNSEQTCSYTTLTEMNFPGNCESEPENNNQQTNMPSNIQQTNMPSKRGLLQDEIKDEFLYDKNSGKLIGFIDLDNLSNSLIHMEECIKKEEKKLATYTLVVMVWGISVDLKFPHAHFATYGITSD
ncbi:unnamed protein product [Mytilus coruscus]|uniref:Transposable element P transposase-like RNase H domain-containing protein n=1 Tax=Mytilus coruscus TaxID=42192 RepID=A0A6J8CHP8_MYTCO|nr:unnamed protein product [Mytilus coruscus]